MYKRQGMEYGLLQRKEVRRLLFKEICSTAGSKYIFRPFLSIKNMCNFRNVIKMFVKFISLFNNSLHNAANLLDMKLKTENVNKFNLCITPTSHRCYCCCFHYHHHYSVATSSHLLQSLPYVKWAAVIVKELTP